MRTLFILLLTLPASGCVMMSKKEYQRQLNLMQSTGELTANLDCAVQFNNLLMNQIQLQNTKGE